MKREVLVSMLLAGLMLAMSIPAGAQNRRMAGDMAERQREADSVLVARLELKDEQRSPVMVVLENAREERTKLMESVRASGDRGGFAQMREKMTEIDKKVETDLAGLLSAAQMEVYRKEIQDRSQRRGGRRSGPRQGVQ